MKNTRKLIPALVMLLVSAVLMSTASYAWFSMNKSVDVTGMQITANSDSTYLIIGQSPNISELRGQNGGSGAITTTATVSADDAKVYPSEPKDTITNLTTAAVEGNWQYKVADSPNASESTIKDAVSLTSANFADYVIKKTVYVALTEGSVSVENLVVSAEITANGTATGDSKTFEPVNVLVVSSSASVKLNSTTPSSSTALAASISGDDVVQIDVYIYYWGGHDAVYSTNVANLEGANIKLTFSVT